jgi:hypothetical protein
VQVYMMNNVQDFTNSEWGTNCQNL